VKFAGIGGALVFLVALGTSLAGFCPCTAFFLTSLAAAAAAFMAPGHSPSTRLQWEGDWRATLAPWLQQLGLLLASVLPILVVVGWRASAGLLAVVQMFLICCVSGLLGTGFGAFVSRCGGSLPLDMFLRVMWLFAPPLLAAQSFKILPLHRLGAVDAVDPVVAVYDAFTGRGGWFLLAATVLGGTLVYAAVKRRRPLELAALALVALVPYLLPGVANGPSSARVYLHFMTQGEDCPTGCPASGRHAHLIDTGGQDLVLLGHTQRACQRLSLTRLGYSLPVGSLNILSRTDSGWKMLALNPRECQEYAQEAPRLTRAPGAFVLSMLGLILLVGQAAWRAPVADLPWFAWLSLVGVGALWLSGLAWTRALPLGVFLGGVNLLAWRRRSTHAPDGSQGLPD